METIDKQECLKRFEEFITDVEPTYVFWMLDTVMTNYAKYVITDSSICGSEVEKRQLYYIKLLRDVFIKSEEV